MCDTLDSISYFIDRLRFVWSPCESHWFWLLKKCSNVPWPFIETCDCDLELIILHLPLLVCFMIHVTSQLFYFILHEKPLLSICLYNQIHVEYFIKIWSNIPRLDRYVLRRVIFNLNIPRLKYIWCKPSINISSLCDVCLQANEKSVWYSFNLIFFNTCWMLYIVVLIHTLYKGV